MESNGAEKRPLTKVYIASNISTEKMLDALNYMRDKAHANHAATAETTFAHLMESIPVLSIASVQ